MKQFLLLAAAMLFTITSGFSQIPSSIPYQAVARNASGNLLVNQNIGLRFTVHQATATGAGQYQETQTTTTNKLGLFNVNMGAGTVVSGTFGGITWSDGQPKFLQVEIDPTGGTSYTNMGATQVMSVPYALYAGSAGSVPMGNLTESTSDVLAITGGSNAVVSASGTTLQVKKATASQDGYLSSADWSTFNGKQAALSFSAPLSNSSNTIGFASQTANLVLASPNGSSGAPAFRQVVVADISATGAAGSTTYLSGSGTWSSPIPAGAIMPFAGTALPSGWLWCDGTSYSRGTYAALFSAISTAYGTANSSSFNVPDFRGQFLRGVDAGTGRDPDNASRTAMNAGGNNGNNVGSVEAAALASHTHFTNVSGGVQSGNATTWDIYSCGGVDAGNNFQGRMSYTGGNETRPTNAYVNYIIKY